MSGDRDACRIKPGLNFRIFFALRCELFLKMVSVWVAAVMFSCTKKKKLLHSPLVGPVDQFLHRKRQFSQEATDGRPALRELVLDLELDHVRRKRLEREFLRRETIALQRCRGPRVSFLRHTEPNVTSNGILCASSLQNISSKCVFLSQSCAKLIYNAAQKNESAENSVVMCSEIGGGRYLAAPHRMRRVLLNRGPRFLAVVRQAREARPLARLDGHLDVRVGVEEHAFLQVLGAHLCGGEKDGGLSSG